MAVDAELLSLVDGLNLPPQDKDKLSFCATKINKIKEWIETLPATTVNECSVILYKAMPEICSLKTNPELRLEILELLNPLVFQCSNHLAHDFFNQPIILPEKTMKMAIIAQSLQRHLNDGYMICIKQWLSSGKKIQSAPVSKALYRSINGISRLLLRSYQLYLPKLPGFWRKINNLYQLSLDTGLEKVLVADPLLHQKNHSSCKEAYLRAVILSASGTNQLRQSDLSHLYDALESWSKLIDIDDIANEEISHAFWITTDSDEGPFNRQRLRGAPSPSTVAINLQALLTHLELNDDKELKPALLDKVVEHWKATAKRQQERTASDNVIDVCPGLTNLHDLLLGSESFQHFIQSNAQEEFGELPLQWSQEDTQDKEKSLDGYISTALTSDISDSGVCLKWLNKMPQQVKVGEAIGLRMPGEFNWQLGVVRWLQRHNNTSYAGIQIIAKSLEPSAASTTFDNGSNSPYFRTLMLDNGHILTPAVPFDTSHKIRIRQNGDQSRAQLNHLVMTSGAVSLFKCRIIKVVEHLDKNA